LGSPYVELHDMEAVRTLLQRDVEAEDRQQEERERRRQPFKP
jgi:hypothetical protein